MRAGITPELVAALAGRPTIGEWDVMFPLLTVDAHGFPHVCLLSRAELDTHRGRLCAVLASPTTIANLRRDGRATLLAVIDDAAIYTKVELEHAIEDGDWLGIVCRAASTKHDSLAIELRPATYLPTAAVAEGENWARGALLLAQLKSVVTQER